MNTRQKICIAVVLVGSMAFAVSTQAGTIIVPTVERGHIKDNGSSVGNSNYATGGRELHDGPGGGSFTVETRSYFIFDLSAIPNEATSALFRVYNTPTGYTGPDAFETLELNPIDKHPITAFGGTSPGQPHLTTSGATLLLRMRRMGRGTSKVLNSTYSSKSNSAARRCGTSTR